MSREIENAVAYGVGRWNDYEPGTCVSIQAMRSKSAYTLMQHIEYTRTHSKPSPSFLHLPHPLFVLLKSPNQLPRPFFPLLSRLESVKIFQASLLLFVLLSLLLRCFLFGWVRPSTPRNSDEAVGVSFLSLFGRQTGLGGFLGSIICHVCVDGFEKLAFVGIRELVVVEVSYIASVGLVP